MATYAYYPPADIHRRADGVGFILAQGTDQAAARAPAQAIVGGGYIDAVAAVEIAPGATPVAVQGLPVGSRGSPTWPHLIRGGGFLGSAG